MPAAQRTMIQAHLAALHDAISLLEAKLRYLDDSPVQTHAFWTTGIAEVDVQLTRISTHRTGLVAVRDALATKFGV
jgi:hypothetical protein